MANMTENTPDDYGKICWFEIPVYDAARAKALYADIFGWTVTGEETQTTMKEEGIEAMHFFSKGSLHGTFLLVQDGYHSTKHGKLDKEVLPPLATFCVAECDEILERVKGHGGHVHCPKTQIPGDMGFYARFIDTEENIIGIWSQK